MSQVSQPAAAMTETKTRPFYWSVRRELWENRSIVIAPLAVAALVLFASLVGMLQWPGKIHGNETLSRAAQHQMLVKPFLMAPAPIMLVAFLVGLIYSLDALYGERRDRSILFWKSLPVSDRATVLAKASIPLGVLPLYSLLLCLAMLAVMLLAGTAILWAGGLSPAPLWRELHLFQQPVVMAYGLAAHVLWFAPIYSWLLLLSAWARRLPLLWLVLPPVAILVAERIALGSSPFLDLLRYRVAGAMSAAFATVPRENHGVGIDRLAQLDPLKFLSSPGLWSGLIFAFLCLAAAVRLRRHREPI